MLTFQDVFIAPGAKTCPTGSWASEGTPERTENEKKNDATWNPRFWWGHGGGVVWSHELLGSRTSWGAIGQRWKKYEKNDNSQVCCSLSFLLTPMLPSNKSKRRGPDCPTSCTKTEDLRDGVPTQIDCKCQELIILIKAYYSDKGQIIETPQSWKRELHLRSSKVCVFTFIYIHTQFTSHYIDYMWIIDGQSINTVNTLCFDIYIRVCKSM